MEDKKLISLPEVGKIALTVLNEATPIDKIKQRPGNAGRTFKYIEIGYVVKQLDRAFGRLWDWEIIDQNVGTSQLWVKGRLTVHLAPNFDLKKETFGSSDIKKFSQTGLVIDIGNDLKSASSDALKKAASMLGIASDVYFPAEFEDISSGWDGRASTKDE